MAVHEQYREFTLVKNNLKKTRKRQIERSIISTSGVYFKLEDLIYYKNYRKRGKLDTSWRPYYVVVRKTDPISYRIKDQFIADRYFMCC